MGRFSTARRYLPPSLGSLTPDGRLLLATKATRAVTMSMLSVVLAIYLASIGYSTVAIGIVLALALVGEIAWTVGLTSVADRLGRRRMLGVGAGLMAISGLALAAAPPFGLLIGIAFLGALSPSGKDTGPTLAIEQAALPQTTRAEHRTAVFAWYSLVASFAGAGGALLAALPALLQRLGVGEVDSFRPLALGYALGGFALMLMFSRLEPGVEAAHSATDSKRPWLGLHRSRGTVAGLAALFGVDAFAGGLIGQSLAAYWFHLRYGLDTGALGAIFFASNALAGFSVLAAAPLAARIGLINTMVFTHLPSNVMLIFVPFMPTPELAAALFIARSALSQMDVPTRQSYTMAVVDPDERSAAAGLTTVARSVAVTPAPALVAHALETAAYSMPFVLCGVLKIAYDVALWVSFRARRPPEERQL